MSKIDLDQLFEAVSAQLDRDGIPMEGFDREALRDAMSRPGAAEEVEQIMTWEPNAPAPGGPAPDFALPFLRGEQEGPGVRLSDHFGRRPVALIFGSYT